MYILMSWTECLCQVFPSDSRVIRLHPSLYGPDLRRASDDRRSRGANIEDFVGAGADLITVHAESCKHLDRTIASIKERGILAGVALNPATPLQAVEYVLEKVDMVLIMTVNPGFGGQKFIPYTLQKVRDLKKMIDARGLKTDIEVDGGVNLSNVEEIMSAGANIIVAGSAVFNGDVAENTQMFLDILNS